MIQAVLDQDEGAIPLPRASHPRSGLRAGPLRAGPLRAGASRAFGVHRLSTQPVILAVVLAAGGAGLWVSLQPSAETVEQEPLIEVVPRRVDPIAFDDEARLRGNDPVPVQPAVAPIPAAPAAEPEDTSVFRLDNLPVLEADETSLGIDDALDALTVSPAPPAPPQSAPARVRTGTAAKKRPPAPTPVP